MKNIFEFRFVLFAFAATALLLSGCSNDRNLPKPDPDREMHVTFTSYAAIGETTDGVHISSIRIIAIDKSTGKVAFNKSAPYGGLVETADDYKATLYEGVYTFYAIVNEASLGAGAATLAALNLSNSEGDLAAIRVPATAATLTEASMVCVGSVADVTIADANRDGIADIGRLDISVKRLASKLNVNIRKTTPDNVTVNSASLALAKYSHLIATAYDGDITTAVLSSAATVLTGTYQQLAGAYILPEHIVGEGDPSSLTINATHTSGVFTSSDSYTVPLLGDAAKLDIKRNSIYTVNVTIESSGEYGYTPYITYSVADWEQVGGGNVDIGGVITVENEWAAGTVFEENTNDNVVLVGTNGSVTMRFGLHKPDGAEWRASLSNTHDFEFVGVSGGVARQNHYEITIRPKDEFDSDDISTELSVRINTTGETDGWEEWDLNRNNAGRYVIKYSQTL